MEQQDEDELLRPCKSYTRFANDRHKKQLESAAREASLLRKNKTKSTSKSPSPSSASRRASGAISARSSVAPAALVGENASPQPKRVSVVSANSQQHPHQHQHQHRPSASPRPSNPEVIDDTSGEADQRRIAATFCSTHHRLSYLKPDVRHNVCRVSSRQEARLSGTLATAHRWPLVNPAMRRLASDHPERIEQMVSHEHERRERERERAEEEAQAEEQRLAAEEAALVEKRRRDMHQPQHFISVAGAATGAADAGAMNASAFLSASGAGTDDLFSVPFSDESIPPLFPVETAPAEQSDNDVKENDCDGEDGDVADASSSEAQQQQQQQQHQQQNSLSPARRELIQSLATATWKYPTTSDVSDGSDSGGQSLGNTGHFDELAGGAGAGAVVAQSSMSGGRHQSASVKLPPDSDLEEIYHLQLQQQLLSPSARKATMQRLLSQQLAQRYVATFKASLANSGVSDSRWRQLPLAARDAYMREWRCCALMRKTVLGDFDALVAYSEG